MSEFDSFEDISERAVERAREAAAEFGYKHTPGFARVIEMVLIGAVTAGLIHLFSLPRMEEKIEQLSNRLERAEQSRERAEQKYDRELQELRHDLYMPRAGQKVALEPFQSIASSPANGH